MKGGFRIGLVVAVLLAVATVLIAPTVDLPETVLRGDHLVSHAGGEHGHGNLQKTASDQSPSYLITQMVETYRPISHSFPDHVESKPSRILRC
jgi:hypothetical protein